jgi:hypothetical protein
LFHSIENRSTKMNVDDPKLTAYALDELNAAERLTIATAIANCPEAQRFVADTKELARALRSQYSLEVNSEVFRREKLMAIHDESIWSKAGPLAIAAALAVSAVIAAIALSTNRSSRVAAVPDSSLREARPAANQFAPVEADEGSQSTSKLGRDADAGPYAYTGDRPFVSVASRPNSSFPLLVNLASYLDVRRSINAGVLPARDAVRVEEMINYFPYEYSQPKAHEPFSLNVDVVGCPWEATHRLVRIGLKGGEAMTLTEGSRVEIAFNARHVASYRLIGYDRQSSARQSINEGTSSSDRIEAGYALTVFYEVVPLGQQGAAPVSGQRAEPMLTAKLQLRTVGNGAVPSIERVITDAGSAFARAPADLKFAAAVAEFGMILRDSEYKGNGTLEKVVQWAQEGKGADSDGQRADFIELVRKAQALRRG